MKKLLIVCICLVGVAFSATAQMEVSVHASIEIPLDELKWVFKPAVGMVATVSKTKRYKKRGSAMGASLGYTSFTPKQETFYYLVNGSEVGTIKYDNMKAYQLSFQYREDFIINKKIEVFAGGEIGVYYTKYGFDSDDPYQDIHSNSFVGRYVVAPKAGVNYMFNKQFSFYFQTRYAVNMAKSDIPDDTFNLYWTNSLGVNYRF